MKIKIFYVLILAFLAFISFHYEGFLRKTALSFSNFILSNLYNFKDFLSENISIHFNQAKQIAILRMQNEDLRQKSALNSALKFQLDAFLEDKNSSKISPNLRLVRALSWVEKDNFRKLWLELDKSFVEQNRGLIYQGYTAGIAVKKDNLALGILQGDEDCAFSVFIGQQRASAFAIGENGEFMAKFIPKTAQINVGDKIFTSGLDGIFLPGIEVGEVSEIYQNELYQSVKIRPFAKIETPVFFYLLD